MPSVGTTRLLVVVAAVELVTGVILYAFPSDFSPAIYGLLLPHFPALSAAQLVGGILALLIVRYIPTAPLRQVLGILASVPLFLMAFHVFPAGGLSGGTAYICLALGLLASVCFNPRGTDLFGLTLGSIHLVVGALMLFLPRGFGSPAFEFLRPVLAGVGLIGLSGAALLLIPGLHRTAPLWFRRVGGALLPAVLCYGFILTGTWTSVVLWLLLTGGSLLDSHPILTQLYRPDPDESPDPDVLLAARFDHMLETLTWVLILMVVLVTSYAAPYSLESTPRAFVFVLLLGGYNILFRWLMPLLGSPRVRLNMQLLVISLAVGVLFSGESPVAPTLFPVLLAVPLVAARAGGPLDGFAMLGAVMVILTMSTLLHIKLDEHPFRPMGVNLLIQLITLGITGTFAVHAGDVQRKAVRQLKQIGRELARSNEELQAANEELHAQGEELAAQQDELMSQHQQLLTQANLLAEQRDELQKSEARFRAAFEHTPVGMAMVSLALEIITANDALGQMLGYSPSELAGMTIQSLTHPDDYPKEIPALDAVRTGRAEDYRGEHRCLHRDGGEVWVNVSLAVVRDSWGHPLYLVGQVLDVSLRRQAEAELHHLANHDFLTGLINRRRFQEEVGRLICQAGQRGALLFLDCDQFKFINDTLGHQAGDELLKSLARLLVGTLGERGLVARLGGDEFGMLIPEVDGVQAEMIATDLLVAVRSHIAVLAGQPVGVTVSIGIALYPEHGSTVEELMPRADLAMYQVKGSGRDGHRLYVSGDLEAEMGARLNWEQRLREALDEDRFVLHFQPMLDIRTGRVTQYEALLRMVERDGTLVGPGEFLKVAESYGLIHAIDRWVVRRAIRTIAEQRQRERRLSLSVNLSARAFSDPGLLRLIRHELRAFGVEPGALLFEITETAAVADLQQAANFVRTLTGMGCQFALDDFGAGYSSLGYLRKLPVSHLKIDGAFIERLPQEPADQKLVKGMVSLAGALGVRTVAEYVSSAETLALLRELGVDFGQGNHIGMPGPLPEM